VAGELCVVFKAADRADLGEQLRGRNAAAAGQLEQHRRCLRAQSRGLAVKLDDCASQ
jgi:hypothetical protein